MDRQVGGLPARTLVANPALRHSDHSGCVRTSGAGEKPPGSEQAADDGKRTCGGCEATQGGLDVKVGGQAAFYSHPSVSDQYGWRGVSADQISAKASG